MKKYERKNIKLSTNGKQSVEVQLITNMRTGMSHLELSFEKKIRVETKDRDKLEKLAEQLMNGSIGFDDISDFVDVS